MISDFDANHFKFVPALPVFIVSLKTSTTVIVPRGRNPSFFGIPLDVP